MSQSKKQADFKVHSHRAKANANSRKIGRDQRRNSKHEEKFPLLSQSRITFLVVFICLEINQIYVGLVPPPPPRPL